MKRTGKQSHVVYTHTTITHIYEQIVNGIKLWPNKHYVPKI
jgi:hypothetical protein